MKSTKKMVLVPCQDGEGVNNDVFDLPLETQQVKKGNSIRKYAAERQRKLLIIVLKLAAYGGYDENGVIKDTEHDIVPLLLHSLSPGRNVAGIQDFVNLLHKAGVSPDLIINADVRELLRRKSIDDRQIRKIAPVTRQIAKEDELPPPPPMIPRPPQLQLMVPENDPRVKRKRDDDDDGNDDLPPKQKHKSAIWDDNDSDLDDNAE